MRVGILLSLLLLGCGSEKSRPASTETTTASTLKMTSTSFATGQRIPRRCAHRPEGQNVSPQLAWKGAPEGTREFALLCDDPDAPRAEPWVHWVLYRIPSSATGLQEGAKGAGVEGRNDFGELGWGGPLPPAGHGTHHYRFRLYALKTQLGLGPGATKRMLIEAMKGRILAEVELVGTYSIG